MTFYDGFGMNPPIVGFFMLEKQIRDGGPACRLPDAPLHGFRHTAGRNGRF
jgi:hypothetical protein